MTRTLPSRATLALATLAALGLAAALPQAASAQSVFTFTGGGQRTDAPGYTLGYSFTTGSAPTLLTALGYFAPNALLESHEVGLFTLSGTQLADATVLRGQAGTAGDPFAYAVGYTPENGFLGVLTANTPYLIGGFNGTPVNGTNQILDPFIDTTANPITGIDGFTDGNAFLRNPNANRDASGFGAPITFAGGNGYGGPNLEVAAAPEPSQFAGLGLGLLGLCGLGWKARKRAA